MPLDATEPSRRPAVWAVLAMLALGAGLRCWIAWNSEIISLDGTYYIHVAKALQHDPLSAARQSRTHPGYPAAICAVHGLLTGLGAGDGVGTWELSGRAVSILAGTAATAAVACLAWLVFGPAVACCAALLASVARKWAIDGAEVVSDPLALCFQLWAAVLAIVVMDRLAGRRGRALPAAAAVGLCGGMGFLVRPEAALVPLLAGAWWLAQSLRGRLKLARAALCVAAMLAALGICVASFWVAVGRLTSKTDVMETFIGALSGGQDAAGGGGRLATAAVAPLDPGVVGSVTAVVRSFFEAQHPVAAFLTCGYLAAAAIAAVGARRFGEMLPRPRRDAGLYLGAMSLVFLIVGGAYYNQRLTISHRYLLLPALLLTPLAGAAIVLGGRLAAAVIRPARAASLQVAATAILAAAAALPIFLHTALTLPHEGKMAYRQAGQFVRQWAGQYDVLLCDSSWIVHYADMPGHVMHPPRTWQDLAAWAYTSRATLAVVSGHPAADLRRRIDPLLATGKAALLADLSADARERSDHVLVLHVQPDELADCVRYDWAFSGYDLDDWVTAKGVSLLPAAAGVRMRTTAHDPTYQLWCPAVDLPPGRHLVEIDGSVVEGDLFLGVEDFATGTWIATAAFDAVAAAPPDQRLVLEFTLKARTNLRVIFSNGKSGGPCLWQVRGVRLGRPASP